MEAGAEVFRDFTGEANPDLPQLDRLAVLVLPSYLLCLVLGLFVVETAKA